MLDDPRPEPFLDQPQDPSIANAVLEKPQQPAVIKTAEEVADVRVEHPVDLPVIDPGRQRIQRVMRRASRPEPVGEADEVRLIDAVEHLHDGTLEELVLKRRDPERALPPTWFRDPR